MLNQNVAVRLLAGLGLLCVVGVSQADHGPVAAEPVTLTEIKIVGERIEGSLTAPGVGAAQEAVEHTPGAVDFVAAEEYQNSYALNIKDMLAYTPGVFAQTRFGEEVRLSIRGSGLSRFNHLRGVLLLQDGVPINLPDGFGDFQELDPLSFRYIEVYRGGNGLRYGSSALGGAINFVTPTGRTAAQQNLVRLEGGSFDTFREHVALARAYDGWDFYASATANNSEGFRPQSELTQKRFMSNLGFQLGQGAETRFYFNWNDVDQEIPGTLTLQNALYAPRTVVPNSLIFGTGRDVDALRFSNKTSVLLGGGQLDLGGYYFFKQLNHPITNIYIDQQGNFHGLFAQWKTMGTLAGRAAEFVLGTRYGTGNNKALVLQNLGGGTRGNTATADADEKATQLDVYTEGRIGVVEHLHLIVGGQYVQARREYINDLNPADNAGKTYEGYSPKIGVLWEPRPSAQVFANVHRSCEPPIFGDLNQAGNPNGFIPLNGQKSWTGEIGTRGARGGFEWDVTAYYTELEGEMLSFTPGANVPATTFNAQDTIHQGLETAFGWTLWKDLFAAGDALKLRDVYTYSDFRFNGDRQFGDNRLAGAPVHHYRAELRYEGAGGYYIAPSLERVPDGPDVDYSNTTQAPGYNLFNVAAGVTLRQGLSLFLDARNLTNVKYVSSISTQITANANSVAYFPGEGRGIFGGVRWAF